MASHRSNDQIIELKSQAQTESQRSTAHIADTEKQIEVKREDTSTEGSPSPPPYSLFSLTQKGWILFIAAWSGWLSTASSFIYFPAIPFLADDMHESVQNINLTVTSYLIASGIFPAITGSVADVYGRRITLIVSLTAYMVISIGLATQRSFAALFILRMLQSVAISAGYSITYGLLGDLTTPAERGGYTGAVSMFLNTPPSIAPMISGLLLIKWPWPSIFWFLAITSSAALLAIIIFLPETCRAIVGNGSYLSTSWNKAIIPTLTPRTLEPPAKSQRETHRNFNNPFSGLALLRHRATLVVASCFGIYYMVHTCLQASLSTIFVEVYGVSGLVAGLVYVPFGVGCIISSFVAGNVVNRDYQITANSNRTVIDRLRGNDISSFPIEHARLRTLKYAIATCAPLVATYGWVLQMKAKMAVPLVLQFLIGFTNQPLYNSLNTLLVDYHPGRSASVQAANNLVRCELAAAGLAVLDVMIRKMGPGWCFVVFAALHGVTLPVLFLLERKGMSWRQEA